MSQGFAKTTLTRTCLLAGSLVLVLLVGGCSTTPMSKTLLNNNSALTAQVELVDTPFFPQEKYQCGPAALATVLNIYDQNIQPDELTNKVFIPEKQGSVAIEIIAAARSYEQLAYPLERSLAKLLQEVEAGNPVLVMQNLGFNWQPQWHYAVVVGFNLDKKSITLRSGTEKRHTLPLKTFERTWRRASYWALVVVPPTQVPATAETPRYIKAAQELESTGHMTSAKQAYQAAIKRWPDNSLPWLALGNLYYTQNKFSASEQTFRQALQQHPNSPELWNNMSYALLKQGCKEQAKNAAQCAIQRQPDNTDYQHSLSDISKASISTPSQCQPINCSR